MEFLGTKESWSVYGPGHVGCTNVSIGDCNGFNGYIELWHHHYKNKEVAKANALLISKSPILLQAIYDSIQELKEAGLTAMAEYHEKLYFECVNL
jgi:hypothetical protein